MRIVRILLWFLQLLVGAVAIAVAISPFRQQFSSGEIAWSIKGNVKKNTSPSTGSGEELLDFQPCQR